MRVKLLIEHHLEFLSLRGVCTGSSESTLFKMPHCWKSHVAAHIIFRCANFSFFASLFFNTEYYPASLPVKSDSDFMFCLQNYQGLIIDRALVY